MNRYLLILFLIFFSTNSVLGKQLLLDRVKNNSSDAVNTCSKFKELNSKNISANSNDGINYVKAKYKENSLNAEMISIYIIGLHCPEVY